MASKAIIINAGNVMVPAYLTLLQKGYQVSVERDNEKENWVAENHQCKFVADDPVALLGLVCVFEVRGKSWQASDEQISQFLEMYEQPHFQ